MPTWLILLTEPTMNLVLTTCVIIWRVAPEELVQRKHHYAMVDEVDSVLIDDARTPLLFQDPFPREMNMSFMI